MTEDGGWKAEDRGPNLALFDNLRAPSERSQTIHADFSTAIRLIRAYPR